nr:ribosomal protein S14 [Bigelowiella natans]
MRRVYLKDKLARQVKTNVEREILILRSLLSYADLPRRFRINLSLRLALICPGLLPIRNICVATSRSRGVFRKYKLSRIMLRDMGLQGLLPGFKKR